MDQTNQPKIVICALCEVSEGTSKHHVLPKSQGGTETVLLCEDCHKQIHTTLTNKQIEKCWASIESLKEHEEIAKWIAWRQKHPGAVVSHKQTKERKRFSKFA
jgi:hypothetical protein